MTEERRVPLNRIERILATFIAAVGALSLLSVIAVMIARAAEVSDFSAGVWPAVVVLPVIGLPIAFVLIIVFVVVAGVRRRRLAQDGAQ